MAKGGVVANHLLSMSKKLKPTLRINAYMDSYGDAPVKVDESKYMREDMQRCKAQIKAIQKALDNWVPEDVADRAHKSLRKELGSQKARLIELKARMDALKSADADEDEDESEESDD